MNAPQATEQCKHGAGMIPIVPRTGLVEQDAVGYMCPYCEIERLQILAANYGGQLTVANAALRDIYDWYMTDGNEDRGGHALEVSSAVLGLSTVDRPAHDVPDAAPKCAVCGEPNCHPNEH